MVDDNAPAIGSGGASTLPARNALAAASIATATAPDGAGPFRSTWLEFRERCDPTNPARAAASTAIATALEGGELVDDNV